jgi:ATP-dependent DNA helicase RecG
MNAPFTSSRLDLPVQFVRGIGPQKAAALGKIGVKDVLDLFFYVPRRYLDRSILLTIAQLRATASRGEFRPEAEASEESVRRDVTVVGDVRSFKVLGVGRKARFVLVLGDQTGSMQCVWFGGVAYWKKAFSIGEVLAVSGQPTFYGGTLQFVHPDFDRLSPAGGDEEIDWTKTLHTGGLVPIYPSSQELSRVGLDSRGFRRSLHAALHTVLETIPETLPEYLREKRDLSSLHDSIRNVHFPGSVLGLQSGLRRLKYEELFHFQLKLALKRHAVQEEQGIGFVVKSSLARRLVDSLPFTLTRAQVRVINEISADMAAARPMNRLLQGDVGSGKTIVALLAMLIAVDNGYQAAFMAPTEILAEQHFKTLSSFLRGLPVAIRLLVGAQRSRLRQDILEDALRGTAHIVVGTHALFEKKVAFHRLGLVIIDEQHRFGVRQRALARQKGVNPDVLVMTATPIPRTLSLTLYGDLDVSLLDELPKDRRSVKTVLKHEEEKESVYRFVREEVGKGRQAYFVYPLIEESEKVDLKAATIHCEQLQKRVFPDLRLGLIHGRLDDQERERVMEAFQRREIDILVATTVIEVGIDVPNASVMVIENAERFGLSQLHQLRGRVGRGSDQSTCILLAKKWLARRAEGLRGGLGDSLQLGVDEQHLAERRLAAILETNDGFKIAEYDLELRGPGDFFGTRQSGIPEFRVADILTDGALLDEARHDAFGVVRRDPRLAEPAHRMLAEHFRTRFRDDLSLLRTG